MEPIPLVEQLHKWYYTLAEPPLFGSARKIVTAAGRHQKPSVRSWLSAQDAYTLPKPYRRRSLRWKTVMASWMSQEPTTGSNCCWQCLMILGQTSPNLKRQDAHEQLQWLGGSIPTYHTQILQTTFLKYWQESAERCCLRAQLLEDPKPYYGRTTSSGCHQRTTDNEFFQFCMHLPVLCSSYFLARHVHYW